VLQQAANDLSMGSGKRQKFSLAECMPEPWALSSQVWVDISSLSGVKMQI